MPWKNKTEFSWNRRDHITINGSESDDSENDGESYNENIEAFICR